MLPTLPPKLPTPRSSAASPIQKASAMTRELLDLSVRSKPALAGLPVIANIDFGHTDPLITFPIGGEVEVRATTGADPAIRVTRH
jgi:muramoyltetrapeptide carboxypeptidase